MAYSSWAIPNKTSGSGNDNVQWTGAANTGRNARTTTAKFKASGVADQTLTIKQLGKVEFVEISGAASVQKTGGTITISGKSNSSKLNFTLGRNDIGLTIPAKYNAGGVQTSNNAEIAGDPGASAEFDFSIQFANIGANETVDARISQLTVTDAAGNTAVCTITQAAGDPVLTIDPIYIELAADGQTPVDVAVTSNTSWVIE